MAPTTKKSDTLTMAELLNIANPKFQQHGWKVGKLCTTSPCGTVVTLSKSGKAIDVVNTQGNVKETLRGIVTAKDLIIEVAKLDKIAQVAIKTKTPEKAQQQKEEKVMASKTTPKKTDKENDVVGPNHPNNPIPADAPGINKNAGQKSAPKNEEKPAKPVGKLPENPAGKATPVYEALKKVVDTDTAVKAKLETAWEEFGKTYDFSVSKLTKALLAEGVWAAAKNDDGTLKAGEDGLAIPVGYQNIYKQEKEQGVKGIGHFVNVAAASFGRHNMTKKKEEQTGTDSKGGTKGADLPPDEKAIAKKMNQMEAIALKLPLEELKSYLETSKAFAPALKMLMEENKALDALGDDSHSIDSKLDDLFS